MLSLVCTSTWDSDPMFTTGRVYKAGEFENLYVLRDDQGHIRYVPKDTMAFITGYVQVAPGHEELPRYARFKLTEQATTYAHTYTLAFTVETPVADPFEVPESELRNAAMRRIAELNGIHEWSEACSLVDTYEVVD